MAGIKVFIVDDHYMVVEGIRSLLQGEPAVELTGSANTAAACLQAIGRDKPDVILMDVNLPDMDGTLLCRQVKNLFPTIFVLGLSTFNKLSVIGAMLDNGASGYLLKNASQEELTAAIKLVMRGKVYLSPDVQRALLANEKKDTPLLTRREKEVLAMIADGLTNPEIAEKLYVGVSTVNSHRKNLLQKLDAKNTASLVKIAMDQHLL